MVYRRQVRIRRISVSLVEALFFRYLQGATFYREVFEKAVATVPAGEHQHWIDIGCGPGLLSRLAARKGYNAWGWDLSSSMVHTARRIAKKEESKAKYVVRGINDLTPKSAFIVSAASLLPLLDDVSSALRTMWDAVQVGGYLLVIEPTDTMRLFSRKELRMITGKRAWLMQLWVKAREDNILDPRCWSDLPGGVVEQFYALNGQVGIWRIQKTGSTI
jgi:2-polyprenyl-3-methyl-5-hydroxy-6-metoxy-1,4-benzoquinol methylase